MSQLDEIYDNERIEKDTFRSMRELSKYTKILSKENNIFVVIKKKLLQIKLSSSKSLFKISLLLDTLPEENVSFTYYTEEKNEQNDINNNVIINNKIDMDKSKNKKNKKKNGDIYIINNIKNNYAKEIHKKGKVNIIGYNYNLFKLLWKYLYILNLIISIISFIYFSAYSLCALINKKYFLLFSNIITILSLCLNIFASNSGYKKIIAKKKMNLRMENIIFICFIHLNIFCEIFWIYIFNKKENEIDLNMLLMIEIILGLIDIICALLIWLNIKIVEFLKEYWKLNDEGIPLVEI